MSEHVSENRVGGFTLIEVLFVLAISAIFAGATFPLGQTYLRREELEKAVRDVASSVRYAQEKSQAGSFDSAWGVKVSSGSVTVFQGATYATRDSSYDQLVSMPTALVPSGTTEFDFARRTGRTTSGTLTITDAWGAVRTVAVNGFGTVEF